MKTQALQLNAERKRYDLVVIGGGVSGICAAIAAARLGVGTALVHDRPVLGGNASSEMRVGISSAVCSGMAIPRQARETGIVEELGLESMARNPVYDAAFSVQDIVFWEAVKNEKLIDLYLNCRAVHAVMGQDGAIDAVAAISESTGKAYLLQADYFIDSSGDGQIAYSAGADFMCGREARSEFAESMAPETGGPGVMSPTIFFTARNVGKKVEFVPPAWAYDFPTDDSLPFRYHDALDMLGTPGEGTGFWWIEYGGVRDTVNEIESIRDELIKILFGVWDHLKNHGNHGMDHYTLCWFNPLPAKRESRRFIGDVIVTQNDILHATPYPDGVAYGGWPIDIHPPEGIFSPAPPCTGEPLHDLWSIPFRCLYSRNVPNLMMAGRNVSVTHVALGSIRVMATCGLMGQAVGTAAALCKKYGIPPRVLCQEHIGELQQLLLKNDCYIKGIKDTDSGNIARKARAYADSDAALTLGGTGKPVALQMPAAQLFPVTADRIENVQLYLSTASAADQSLDISLMKAERINRFTDCGDVLVTARAVVPAHSAGWVKFELDAPVVPGNLYWVKTGINGDVAWDYAGDITPPGTNCSVYHEEKQAWTARKGGFRFRLSPDSRPFGAANVINGVHRAETGSSLWISDPREKLPQSLWLEFDGFVTINSVRISFDSALDDNIYLPAPWGMYGSRAAAPTLARDYRIDILGKEGYKTVARVKNNYLRHRVHDFEAMQARAVRITVLETNGDPSARIYEVRCYHENESEEVNRHDTA